MKVPGLYLGKYLIAVWECDRLRYVADSIKELCKVLNTNRHTIYSRIKTGKYQLIDVTEIHNDCFMEEDLEFLRNILQIREIEI